MAFTLRNRKSWPELTPESPIYFGPVSNGEYLPEARPQNRHAEQLVQRFAAEHAPKLAMSRRQFLESACGMAAALLAINITSGCGEDRGGYAVNEAMLCDPSAANEALAGNEFIYDIQTHQFKVAKGAP